MVHRDLKPANLYLARLEDGKQIIKVLDFGISKASNPFSQTGNHSLTSTKSMLGSPLYMSPEQLRSAKNVDQRADIWSLGVILFELLTGRVPFNGESLGELFVSILEQQTPRLSQIRPDIPQVLDDAVARCLQRPLDARFANVAELAQALAPCAPARAVISVERIFSTLGVQHSAQFPAAHMPQEGSYGGHRPMPPPAQTNTGSGSFSGHHYPQSQQLPQSGMMAQPVPPHTQDSWGRTGSGVQDVVSPPPVNRTPLFVGIGVGALLLFVVGGVGIYAATHRTPKTDDTQTAVTGVQTTPPPPTVTAPTTTATSAATTTTPAPTDSVTVHPTPTGKATGTGTKTNPTATSTGKVTPTATATVTATATTPTAQPTSTGTAKFDPFNTGRKN
jgi:serine/threonine-protein kinase